MKLLTDISSINLTQWETLVAQSPVTSIFQSPEMYNFYSHLPLYDVKVFGVEEDNSLKGVIVCLLQAEKGLKRRLTSRAIISGGPLLDENIHPKTLASLMQATITSLRRQCIYIETRNLNDYSRWKDVFERCGFDYVPHYNFHIDTSVPELVDKRMDKSRRRKIRRGYESGISISNDNEDITAFYNILSDLYHNKIHKPLPPLSMFLQIGETPFAKYFIVKNREGKVIGGQLILMLRQKVAYAWYCCGLDREYHDSYPSIIANYTAIRYAADNGFLRYDMMGAGSPREDYGVRDFKAQFGGTLVEHGRFLYVCRPLIYTAGKLAIKILSKH